MSRRDQIYDIGVYDRFSEFCQNGRRRSTRVVPSHRLVGLVELVGYVLYRLAWLGWMNRLVRLVGDLKDIPLDLLVGLEIPDWFDWVCWFDFYKSDKAPSWAIVFFSNVIILRPDIQII